MTAPATLARNADLPDLVAILRTNHARKLDVVAPVSAIRADQGRLVLSGTGVELTTDGVTTTDGTYQPTAICDGGLADRLGIPPGYLTGLRHKHIDLYDRNINGWLTHPSNQDKHYLVRCFRSDDGGIGVGRAFLSNSYKPIENLDVLMTVLEGIGTVGVDVEIAGCDLTDRRMYVKIVSPQVTALAPTLLRAYRSPFSGDRGADNPVVFAGLQVTNSEVGHGAFQIAPTITIQVCKNGMTVTREAVRAQHLGGKLEPGTIVWSDETQAKNLELIKAKTADAVRAFLSEKWLQRQIDRIEQTSNIEVKQPEETVKVVAEKLRYTEAQQNDILRMFIKGGDTTAGGVMQAVTASAQNQTDADVAADMEGDALRVLELAAAHALR